MPLANWFFGFPLGGDFVNELPPPPVNFRVFDPDDVHLTLAFLGACGEAGAERALSALDRQLLGPLQTSLHVSLGQVVPMGPRGRYSALSALLEEGRQETEARITTLRDALTLAASERVEQRPAKAHVTVARPTRHASDPQRAAGLLWAAQLDLRAVRAHLNRIALYTWSETRRERLFRIVAERSLADLSLGPLLTPIRSERLVLEPMRGFHSALLFAGLSEPRLYRWVSALPPPSSEHLRQRWDAASNGVPAADGKTLLNWAMRRVSDGAYVGKCDAVLDAGNIAINVGYLTFLPFWGQGYATEAVRAVAAHLEQQGIAEQHAFVTLGNAASERVLVKAGFERIRIIPENDVIRGQKFDDVEYARGLPRA